MQTVADIVVIRWRITTNLPHRIDGREWSRQEQTRPDRTTDEWLGLKWTRGLAPTVLGGSLLKIYACLTPSYTKRWTQ